MKKFDIKKLAILLLTLVLALCFVACGETGTDDDNNKGGNKDNPEEKLEEVLPLPAQDDYTEYDFPDYSEMTSFCNTEQYANMQSYCGWYYCYGSTDEGMEYMSYDPYSGAYRGGSSPIMYVQKDEWQPSNEYEMACCFKAPRTGEVTINISLRLIYEQGEGDDGVSFYCLSSLNNSDSFCSAYLVGSRSTAEKEVTLNVKKGEVLYFVMSANEGRYNDLTRVNIKINYGE